MTNSNARAVRWFVGVAIVSLVSLVATPESQAQPQTQPLTQPQTQVPATVLRASSASIGEGLSGIVIVDITGVSNLFGAEITVAFDPTVVQVVDAAPSAPGVQVRMGDFLDPGIVALNVADNAAGTIECAWTQLSPSPPKSGDGTLLVIEFRGVKAGTVSEVTIAHAVLVDSDVKEVPRALAPGSIDVVSKQGAPQTPTPAAEQQPIITLPASGGGQAGVYQKTGDGAETSVGAVREDRRDTTWGATPVQAAADSKGAASTPGAAAQTAGHAAGTVVADDSDLGARGANTREPGEPVWTLPSSDGDPRGTQVVPGTLASGGTPAGTQARTLLFVAIVVGLVAVGVAVVLRRR